jgi:hypothetical protein
MMLIYSITKTNTFNNKNDFNFIEKVIYHVNKDNYFLKSDKFNK